MVVDFEEAQCQQQPVVTKCRKPTDGRRCYAVRVCIEKNPPKIKCEPCPAPPVLPPLCNRPPIVCCNCKSPPAPPPCSRPKTPPCARPAPQPPPRSPCSKKRTKCQMKNTECQTCNQCPRNEKNTQCCLAPPPPPPKCRTQDMPCQTYCKETRHCGHQISPGCCQKHTKHCQTELDSGCCAEGVAHDRQTCGKPCCRKPAAAANNNCGETRDARCNTTTAKANNCSTGCGKGDGGETWNKNRANRKKVGNANKNRRPPPPPPPAPIPQNATCGERQFEFPFLGRTSSGNLKVRPSMVSYENREFGILVANPDCMRTSVKKITSCDMLLSDPSPSPPCRRPPQPPRSRPQPCGPCGEEESPPASTCKTACQRLPPKGKPASRAIRTQESRRVQYHHQITEEYSDIETSALEDEQPPMDRCTTCSSRPKVQVPRNKMERNDRFVERESCMFGDGPEAMEKCNTLCSSNARTHVSRNKMGHAESWNYVDPTFQKGQPSKRSIKKQQSTYPPPDAPPVQTVSRGYQPSYFLEAGGPFSKHTANIQQSGLEGMKESEMNFLDEGIQTSFQTQPSRSRAGVSAIGSQRPLPSAPAFPHHQQSGFMSDADGYHTPTELRFVAGSKTAPENYSMSIPMTMNTNRPSATSQRTQRSSPTVKSSVKNVDESESEMVGKLHYVLKGTVDPDAKVTVGDAVFPVHSVVLEIRKRPESNKQRERKGQTPSTKEISNVKLPDFDSLPINYNEGPSDTMGEETATEATQDEISHMDENERDYVDHISVKPVDRISYIGGDDGGKSTSKVVEAKGWQDDYSMGDRIHVSAVGSSISFIPSEYKGGRSQHHTHHTKAATAPTSAVASSMGFLPEEYETEAKPTRENHDLLADDESVPVSEDEHPLSRSHYSGHTQNPSRSGQIQSQAYSSQDLNQSRSGQTQMQNQSGQQRSYYSSSNIKSQQQLENDEDTETSREVTANKSFRSSNALPPAESVHPTKSDLSRHQRTLNPFTEGPMESESQVGVSGRIVETTESSGTVLLAPQPTEDTLMQLAEPSGTLLYPQQSMNEDLSTDREDYNEVPYDPEDPAVGKHKHISHEEEDANAPKQSLLPNLDVIHGAIIAFGGINPRKPWAEWNSGKDVFMYTKDTDKWTKVGHLPAPRSHYGVARVENDVYIIGGTDPSHKDSHHKNVAVSTNFKVNLRSGEWDTQLTELPQARSHFGCAAINNSVYVIGGNVDSRATSSCLKYDTESREWSEIAPLDTTRSHMGIEVYKNGILVAGGTSRDAKKPVLETVMFYDPALNSWIHWKSLPSPRAFSTLAVVGDQVYLVAGAGLRDVHKRRNTSLPDILYFDQAQNRWEEAGTLRHPRHGHASAVIDDSIVVIAGVSSHFQGPINAVDIWSPASPHSRKAHHFRHSQSGMSAITL